MKILITGGRGQLARELDTTKPSEYQIAIYSHSLLDITSIENTRDICNKTDPDVIINTAAYTKVDQAEIEYEKAYEVNARGAENLALTAKERGIKVIHISTDYVFDGKRNTPYTPDSETNPIGAYGRSKSEGEKILRTIYPEKSIIIRTSWLYSRFGSNFVKNILNMLGNKPTIRVISDQIGTPTWARTLATSIWSLCRSSAANGVFHCTDNGVASWYDFAYSVQQIALTTGLVQAKSEIIPITTAEYSMEAKRPHYSVLDCRMLWDLLDNKPDHWMTALTKMLLDFKLYKDA